MIATWFLERSGNHHGKEYLERYCDSKRNDINEVLFVGVKFVLLSPTPESWTCSPGVRSKQKYGDTKLAAGTASLVLRVFFSTNFLTLVRSFLKKSGHLIRPYNTISWKRTITAMRCEFLSLYCIRPRNGIRLRVPWQLNPFERHFLSDIFYLLQNSDLNNIFATKLNRNLSKSSLTPPSPIPPWIYR